MTKRTSIWISLALVLVGGFALFAQLHSRSQTRPVGEMNSLFVIAPYKYEGIWVFDDPAVGLSREPFIAGIDTMIDKAVAKVPNAERGFRAVFSQSNFPGATFKLQWRRA